VLHLFGDVLNLQPYQFTKIVKLTKLSKYLTERQYLDIQIDLRRYNDFEDALELQLDGLQSISLWLNLLSVRFIHPCASAAERVICSICFGLLDLQWLNPPVCGVTSVY
jgi:hypothetical protein